MRWGFQMVDASWRGLSKIEVSDPISLCISWAKQYMSSLAVPLTLATPGHVLLPPWAPCKISKS
jgi:hypothetical protein